MFGSRCSALSLLILPACLQAAEIVPSNPVEFERVTLRQTIDSCAFNEDQVQVRLEGRTIVVVQRDNQCIVPGPPEVVDIQLGAFPAGDYRVEVRPFNSSPPVVQVDFTVSALYWPAVFPPVPRPIANYEGLWWNGGESSWGLSLHQGATHRLFGALYVFDGAGAPRWYTLQSGRWESSTRWACRVFRSGGDPGVPPFDAGDVEHVDVGTAVLDFTMLPGREGIAVLTITIDGTTTSRDIARIRL